MAIRPASKAALLLLILLLTCFAFLSHAANLADPNKVIRVAFETADDGFDLARTANLNSIRIGEAIFEPLLSYDYLARPAKLVPLTAEAMPQVSDAGKTYLFHIKKGIYFAPDAAFKNKRRELTAQDYIYTFKRLLDPAIHSPAAHFLAGKIVGLDALAAKVKKSGQLDYAAPIAGLQAPDRYTLRIQLNKPDYNFLYVIAYDGLGAVAHEVIDTYGAQSGQHPVGSGPYQLQQYVPRSKIILTANPEYRGYVWDFQSSGDPWDDQLVRDMKGKKMPQVGRVEISIIEEEQSRWLAFENKQLDLDQLPQPAALKVLDGDKLKPEYASQGIQLNRVVVPEIMYGLFNMKDPVTGGYTKEKIALRRAIAMSYNIQDEIAMARGGQALKAEMMVPVGVVGHDDQYRSSIQYDIGLANKLLDYFSYRRDDDGYRRMPDGSALILKISNQTDATSKIYAEVWKRGLDKIGIKAEFLFNNYADNRKAAMECKLMMWTPDWRADFPEGENFLQLLYGPNVGRGNYSCYQSAAYDALYLQALNLPPGAERNKIYLQLNRMIEGDTAVVPHISRIRNWLVRPWVKGFNRHPTLNVIWQYLDVEKH